MNIKRYNIIHDELISRLESGEITIEFAKEVNDLAFDDYILESENRMNARIERNKLSFMKKYHYNPEDKTIIVDGEKFKVDMDIDKDTMIIQNVYGSKEEHPRVLSAETHSNTSTIHLDDLFFKIKHADRRDALLQHEIGHIKLHNKNPNSPNFNKNSVSKKVWDDMVLETVKSATKKYGITDNEKIKKIARSVTRYMAPYYIKYNLSNLSSAKRAMRAKAYEIAKKYELEDIDHAKAIEYEADRYAANRTSEKSLKKGLHEAYKLKYGKIPKDCKTDCKIRSQALKDKDLKNNEVYK